MHLPLYIKKENKLILVLLPWHKQTFAIEGEYNEECNLSHLFDEDRKVYSS